MKNWYVITGILVVLLAIGLTSCFPAPIDFDSELEDEVARLEGELADTKAELANTKAELSDVNDKLERHTDG